jgi:hypothetical protein
VNELQRLIITFQPDQSVEYEIFYSHTEELPRPGTKTRTTRATRMARKALETALEGLGNGEVFWGGFGTNERTSKDVVVVDRKGRAA